MRNRGSAKIVVDMRDRIFVRLVGMFFDTRGRSSLSDRPDAHLGCCYLMTNIRDEGRGDGCQSKRHFWFINT